MRAKILGLILLCAFAFSAFADSLVYSINKDEIPVQNTYVAADVGWEYVPDFSYTLTAIYTKFGSLPYGDNRTVTLEIYDGLPGNGGILLGSAGFTPLADTFSGTSFAPINLLAGHTYFIGFRNVANLGPNTTGYVETVLSPYYFSYVDDGSYTFSEPYPVSDASCPILEFYGRARRHNEIHH